MSMFRAPHHHEWWAKNEIWSVECRHWVQIAPSIYTHMVPGPGAAGGNHWWKKMVWVGRDPKNHLPSTPPDQVLFKGETEARRFTQENCAKGSSTKVCLSHPAVWQPCSWETVNIQLMRNNRLILATFKCQKLRLQLLSHLPAACIPLPPCQKVHYA